MSLASQLVRFRGHSVWPQVLDADSVVIDAGAHRGEFSHALRAYCGSRSIMIEANPELASQLDANPPSKVLNAALCGRDGPVEFVRRPNPEAGSIDSRAHDNSGTQVIVEGVSLESLFKRFALVKVDLLKLDIEGAEFEVIRESRAETLQSVVQLTVEFHDFLPEFGGRGLFEAARRRLEELGFLYLPMSFRTHGDALFLNQKLLHFSTTTKWIAPRLARWVMRIKGGAVCGKGNST